MQAWNLPKEDVLLMDIGANVGAHTMGVAAHGFSVLAFEPMHINVMSLRHTLCANPRLQERVTLIPRVG
jgi:FkbM family methyltransferase